MPISTSTFCKHAGLRRPSRRSAALATVGHRWCASGKVMEKLIHSWPQLDILALIWKPQSVAAAERLWCDLSKGLDYEVSSSNSLELSHRSWTYPLRTLAAPPTTDGRFICSTTVTIPGSSQLRCPFRSGWYRRVKINDKWCVKL